MTLTERLRAAWRRVREVRICCSAQCYELAVRDAVIVSTQDTIDDQQQTTAQLHKELHKARERIHSAREILS